MSEGILFLCTENACRSQIAEGFARWLLPNDREVFSAGAAPTELNPRAVTTMAEVGIDITTQHSKGTAGIPVQRVGRVITLCDCTDGVSEAFPEAQLEHWPVSDPGQAVGDEQQVAAAFRQVRDEILDRVLVLVAALAPEPAAGTEARQRRDALLKHRTEGSPS